MRRKKYKTARCILHRDGRYLLADHSPTRQHHRRRKLSSSTTAIRWGLPGGHVEWLEDPMAAARREVLEELNIELATLTPVGDYIYKQRLHAVFAAHSEYEEFDLDLSELAEVRWFTRDEVAHLKHFNQLHAGYELEAIFALEALSDL